MNLELNDVQAEALIRELRNIVQNDRDPLSSRIVPLKEILAKLRLEPEREPLSPRRRPRKTPRDPKLVKALNYAQDLDDAATKVLGAAAGRAKTHENWGADPIVVSLAILCRSISNFRAALLLVEQGQDLEAIALVRLLYENLLYSRAPGTWVRVCARHVSR